MSDIKTFLITAVGSGLGKAFARGAVMAGHRVAGTVRNETDAEEFAVTASDRAHPVLLDVTDFDAIPEAVAKIDAMSARSTSSSTMPATATKAFWKNRRWTTCGGSLMPTCSARLR